MKDFYDEWEQRIFCGNCGKDMGKGNDAKLSFMIYDHPVCPDCGKQRWVKKQGRFHYTWKKLWWIFGYYTSLFEEITQ
jgi:DNA-directed RNA polymerase subunit RPC12/RpoP